MFGRNGRISTDLDVAVRMDYVTLLESPIDTHSLIDRLPEGLASAFSHRVHEGGDVPPVTAEHIRAALTEIDPAAADALRRLERMELLPIDYGASGVRWQHELDATRLSTRIGDFPADALDQWDPPEPDAPALAGLLPPQEPAMIDFDASRFPGMRALQRAHTSIHVFVDGSRRLEVVNANANRVEKALGTDLLYYNHQSTAFVLVQYKKAPPSGDLSVDSQLVDQMGRMDAFVAASASTDRPLDFRLGSDHAAWLKVVLGDGDPKNPQALLRGMYLPTTYCSLLLRDECTLGRKGRVLNAKRVERYFTNTMFVNLVREGWIGTTGITDEDLERYVRDALRNRRSVVLAEEHGVQTGSERRRVASRRSSWRESTR